MEHRQRVASDIDIPLNDMRNSEVVWDSTSNKGHRYERNDRTLRTLLALLGTRFATNVTRAPLLGG